jgi:hypothetical protein
MKFYQVKKLENKLSNELSVLSKRFIDNNSTIIDDSVDYDVNIILEEIKIKSKELSKIRFLIKKYELNISELIVQNNEYNYIIELLNNTPTSKDKNYINTFTRTELDIIIKEYEDKIDKNQETIDYYYFVTDIEV